MSQTKRFVLLAGAALSLGGVNAALAQQAQDTDEVRAVVSEMLADAQNRSSLLAGGNGGHDGNFYLADDAGNFRLNVSGQVQFRYLLNFRDETTNSDQDDFESGFQTRRTKIAFSGHVINPNWTYKVEGAFDRDGGSFNLEDAYVQYNFGNGFRAKWGQFKLPFLREELVSSRYQLAADRSVANEFFNQDRAQGIEIRYEQEAWRVAAAFSDGFATDNTDFNSGAEADWAATGRVEFKFAGDWKDFEDFTSKPGQQFSALVGAAVHYQQSRNTNNPTDVDVNYLGYTFDVSLEGDSWNLYGAFMGSHTEGRATGVDLPDADNFGVVVQGGYRFAQNTELFARYDAVFLDEDTVASGEDSFNFLTVGLNQYYAGHAAKATIDLVYAFEDTTNLASSFQDPFSNGGFPNTGVGLLGDGEDGEITVRFQFQLLF
jgi:phosphate-selective porin OprO/OprP